MISLLATNLEQLAELCRHFRVHRLYVFGSAATGRFQQGASDLDFVADMEDRRPDSAYADRYLGLADALEKLFQCPVDLVTEQSIRNPFLKRQIDATRQLVYARPDQETAV